MDGGRERCSKVEVILLSKQSVWCLSSAFLSLGVSFCRFPVSRHLGLWQTQCPLSAPAYAVPFWIATWLGWIMNSHPSVNFTCVVFCVCFLCNTNGNKCQDNSSDSTFPSSTYQKKNSECVFLVCAENSWLDSHRCTTWWEQLVHIWVIPLCLKKMFSPISSNTASQLHSSTP